MTLPTPVELKRRQLEQQYVLLSRQVDAASQQLQSTINAADRPLLEAQVADLYTRMEQVKAQLDALAPALPPASLTVTIRPRMEQVYTALADLFDPDARPLVEVELRNATAQPRRILVSSHIQEYSHVAETTVTLAPGAVETVRQLPALRKPAVQAITELTKAELSVSVRDLDDDQIVQQQSFPIALLARNAAPIAARDPHTNAWIDMTPYLAAFVTPNAPAVMETLRRAVERHPEQRLAGYQADVGLQVNALYDVLRHDIALAYVQSIISFNPDAAALDQRVRLPAETLRQRSPPTAWTPRCWSPACSKRARSTRRCCSVEITPSSGGRRSQDVVNGRGWRRSSFSPTTTLTRATWANAKPPPSANGVSRPATPPGIACCRSKRCARSITSHRWNNRQIGYN